MISDLILHDFSKISIDNVHFWWWQRMPLSPHCHTRTVFSVSRQLWCGGAEQERGCTTHLGGFCCLFDPAQVGVGDFSWMLGDGLLTDGVPVLEPWIDGPPRAIKYVAAVLLAITMISIVLFVALRLWWGSMQRRGTITWKFDTCPSSTGIDAVSNVETSILCWKVGFQRLWFRVTTSSLPGTAVMVMRMLK